MGFSRKSSAGFVGTSLYHCGALIVDLSGFDWASIPGGSVIVDVGGGTGRPTLTLARAFPHLKIVIQDKESVIQKGIEV